MQKNRIQICLFESNLRDILRENEAVSPEANDPLQVDLATNVTDSYFGKSGCRQDELVIHLPHSGPIYKYNSASVFLKNKKASRSNSIESSVKTFSRKKDRRRVYLTIIENHR